MADENTRPSPDDVRERRIEANLPAEERRQPDPALQLTTGGLGVFGWSIFVVAAIIILTAVLWGLNGPSETSSQARSQASAASNAAAPNTSPGPTPAAPQNGPGAKP
jgi:hypothetical protein